MATRCCSARARASGQSGGDEEPAFRRAEGPRARRAHFYTPHVLVVRGSLAVNSLAELIALARAQPGKLTYASSGRAAPSIWRASCSARGAGRPRAHPYRGGGPAVLGLSPATSTCSSTTPAPRSRASAPAPKALAMAWPKRSPPPRGADLRRAWLQLSCPPRGSDWRPRPRRPPTSSRVCRGPCPSVRVERLSGAAGQARSRAAEPNAGQSAAFIKGGSTNGPRSQSRRASRWTSAPPFARHSVEDARETRHGPTCIELRNYRLAARRFTVTWMMRLVLL